MENLKYFEVLVEDFAYKGDVMTVRQPGYSIWHAIDQVYTRFHSAQPNRAKYKQKKKTTALQ